MYGYRFDSPFEFLYDIDDEFYFSYYQCYSQYFYYFHYYQCYHYYFINNILDLSYCMIMTITDFLMSEKSIFYVYFHIF